MAKTKIFRPRVSSIDVRNKIKFFYMEKFFNKWMSKYDFPELNYQQKHYIMKKFWADGSIAVSKINEADNVLAGLIDSGVIDMKENKIIFTPWAFSNRYNIYDFPTHVRLINTRGVKFITPDELELDKEVVIIYAQKNHKSVFSSIEAKVEQIIDLEMKKRTALKCQSQSWMFAFSPEDYEQAKVLQEQLENDEPYCFVPFNEVEKVKALTSGAPYIVDKIQQEIDGRVNEVFTILGVNNIGIGEKKEHLIVDEVNANNEDIEQQSYSFTSEIEDGFERVFKVLDYKVHVIDVNELFKVAEDSIDEEESRPQKEDEEDVQN